MLDLTRYSVCISLGPTHTTNSSKVGKQIPELKDLCQGPLASPILGQLPCDRHPAGHSGEGSAGWPADRSILSPGSSGECGPWEGWALPA